MKVRVLMRNRTVAGVVVEQLQGHRMTMATIDLTSGDEVIGRLQNIPLVESDDEADEYLIRYPAAFVAIRRV